MIRDRQAVGPRRVVTATLLGGHDGIEPLGVEIKQNNRMTGSSKALDRGITHRRCEAVRTRVAVDNKDVHASALPKPLNRKFFPLLKS